ncbi:MAG TPA: type II/IV secretion system protein [Nitrospirae bacterium]|nr:type II/IV secretion system protein [Nitrospirota bacterium]
MNGFSPDLESLPREVIDLYLKFPDRSDFLPVEAADGRLTFLVSSEDGIRKASFVSTACKSSGSFKFVPQKTLLEIAEKLSFILEEDVELNHEGESISSDEYDILSGVHDDAPVVKLVNQTIMSAIRLGASDIHIEGREANLIVRFRVDGRLKTVKTLDKGLLEPMIARVKVMADMDVAETRRPQDGRINIQFGTKTIDIRVSTIPTAKGEKAVLRLLSRSETALKLDILGLDDRQVKLLKRLLRSPNGIIMVTGPTGSGKTSTLYASILEIQNEAVNIVTIEDPVEYRIDGIAQVQVNPATGVTFARAIRTFLRQDPDVILVGEIRDEETAEAAIQASLTGHLVLTTLHTSDAPTAVARLVEMNIEPFLLSSSLLLVIGQRLVRKICPDCREEVEVEDEIREIFLAKGFELERCFRGRGCEKCFGTGYKGRIGIYEFLDLDDEIRKLIMRKASSTEIKTLAVKQGMQTMFAKGVELIRGGVTTPEEVITVTTQ